ncbi:MAG: SDR family oxidoreductase [Proteobacteria bacterium]|nr:SDR family oxidoreductase [Pseudomonadota bacterium]
MTTTPLRRERTPRVLIAGGAGFLGSHLCERYLAAGWEVLCLDNFHTGSKDNVRSLLSHPRFELVRHDIVEPYLAEIDLILNFACPASPVHYQHNPIKTMKTSVLGTMNLLGLAKRTGARLLQASTSEVYGDPEQHPQTEAYWGRVNPIGIRSCYDEGKRAAETLCFDYHRSHQVDLRLIRIFNTYGPRMAADDGRVVSNFIVQALRGNDLTIYGQGQQTRSFCFVDDLIEGIIQFAAKSGDEVGPLNLGNDTEFTVLELANEVLRQIGGTSKIVYRPLPSDDPRCRRPDLTKAKAQLNWTPRVQLADGLAKTIAYFRSVTPPKV